MRVAAWREGGLVELTYDRGRGFEVGAAWQAVQWAAPRGVALAALAASSASATLLFQLGSGPDQARQPPYHPPKPLPPPICRPE